MNGEPIGWILVVILLPLTGLILCIKEIQMWKDSAFWPRVNGTILESRLKKGKTYKARIRFEYTVNGIRHEARKIRIGGIIWSNRGGGRDKAESYLAKYPVGATVSVLYNPNKPSAAALERGEDYRPILFAVAICLVLLVGGIWGFTQIL